ncbi:terminase, endonuclease subunit [Escherichia coli 3006]|nr:terminase, endonuclease subunit [Escherichia coli 3006]
MMRVSAAMTAQREAAPLRHATVYEQMLVKLAADQRTLKAIYSKELKAAKKRELLPVLVAVGERRAGAGQRCTG